MFIQADIVSAPRIGPSAGPQLDAVETGDVGDDGHGLGTVERFDFGARANGDGRGVYDCDDERSWPTHGDAKDVVSCALDQERRRRAATEGDGMRSARLEMTAVAGLLDRAWDAREKHED